MSHWFHQMANGEPCDTYLKLAAGDLARTCEVIEMQHGTTDGDDTLFIQNLQSVADYIHSASVSIITSIITDTIIYVAMVTQYVIIIRISLQEWNKL